MPYIYDNPDHWFNGSLGKTRKSKGSAGGVTPHAFRSYHLKRKQNNIIKGVQSATAKGKHIPQVMVKISGSSKGCDKAQAHLNYIGRQGEIEIENEYGEKFKGDEQKQLMKAWEATGMHGKHETGNKREAFHIVFSMPKGTNPNAMKTAVKNLVQEEFAGHKYFVAQHLDTDNPHCHVLLSATDDRGARLNPRKADLHNYRVQFVNKLAEQGIEATTSRRVHRFKHQDSKRQGVIHRDHRQGNKAKSKQPSYNQAKKIKKSHQQVLEHYKTFAQTLPVGETQTAVKALIRERQKDKDKGR